MADATTPSLPKPTLPEVRVRRIHRRDLNRTWEFLKRCFRDVNRETVEYQRPRAKSRFLEVYEEDGIEQLLFDTKVNGKETIIGYAECAFEVLGGDNWINARYFSKRDMRPLYVEELAVHPDMSGQGIGSFILEQLDHLARVRGCTHLVLEVAENNENALAFYRGRSFYKLDAAIFLAKKVVADEELLPPRQLKKPMSAQASASLSGMGAAAARRAAARRAGARVKIVKPVSAGPKSGRPGKPAKKKG